MSVEHATSQPRCEAQRVAFPPSSPCLGCLGSMLARSQGSATITPFGAFGGGYLPQDSSAGCVSHLHPSKDPDHRAPPLSRPHQPTTFRRARSRHGAEEGRTISASLVARSASQHSTRSAKRCDGAHAHTEHTQCALSQCRALEAPHAPVTRWVQWLPCASPKGQIAGRDGAPHVALSESGGCRPQDP